MLLGIILAVGLKLDPVVSDHNSLICAFGCPLGNLYHASQVFLAN